MQEQEPTPVPMPTPVEAQTPVSAPAERPATIEQSAVAAQPEVAPQPQLITPESIPGYVAPETPPVVESTPAYSPEAAAAIAQHRIIEGQARMIANTPPMPGTPVETVERPPQA